MGGIGCLGAIAFTCFGLVQMAVGFAGIEQGLGAFWAWAALIAAVVLRFTLPITVGAFFGAMNVWGWPWVGAALFAAPGLLLVVPGVFASVLASVLSTFKRR